MPHNPENIPTSELPPGYRFIDKDEYGTYTQRDLIEFVFANECEKEGFTWYGAYTGHSEGEVNRWTYRTKLSRDTLAKYRLIMRHNPENVPLAILKANEGYRFLDSDEYVVYQHNPPIEYFNNLSRGWESVHNGDHPKGNTQWTYRTKLSRDALFALRADQPPQPTSTPRPTNNPAILTRVHFGIIARQIRKARKSRRAELVDLFLPALQASNPRFNEATFRKAAGAV